MNVRETTPANPPPPAFMRFAVIIDIDNMNQLVELMRAAAIMEEHGVQLYELLNKHAAKYK